MSNEIESIEHNLSILLDSLEQDMTAVRRYLAQDVPQTGTIYTNRIFPKMHKLRAIIKTMPANQVSPNMGTGNSLEEFLKDLDG